MDGRSYQQATETVLGTKPWKTGMAKMTWDAIRATDLLVGRPEVDPQRVGAIGHSLGGKEVLYLAAFDERINAAVSCEGGVGLAFSNWDADWYLGKQIKSPEFLASGRDHHELMALIAPRALLIVGGDGKDGADGAKSWPYIEANLPLWKLLGAEPKLGLLRHGLGHDFPAAGAERERVYRWLDHWVHGGLDRSRS
jgi:pimeloyl-ACP methyl ester carboxylesterase